MQEGQGEGMLLFLNGLLAIVSRANEEDCINIRIDIIVWHMGG